MGVILDSLAAALAAKARLTVLIAAALLVGAAGGVHAATTGPNHPVSVTTVAQKTPADKAKPHKDQQKAKGTAKPAESPGTVGVAGQTHGACVSAVARDKTLVGGRNNNHGGAVSAAAHSCAGSAAKAHKDKKTDSVGKPGKPTKPTKPAKPAKSAEPSDDEQDTTTPTTTTPTTTTTPAS